jgi:hypothetical protein
MFRLNDGYIVSVMSVHGPHSAYSISDLSSRVFRELSVRSGYVANSYIVVGDFNNEFTVDFAFDMNGVNVDMTPLNRTHNTCCNGSAAAGDPYDKKYDNIMISRSMNSERVEILGHDTYSGTLLPMDRELKRATSDHLPVAATVTYDTHGVHRIYKTPKISTIINNYIEPGYEDDSFMIVDGVEYE